MRMPDLPKRATLSLGLPGAGVLVFWQLGVLHGLRQSFDLSQIPLLGSSSGAVAASLAASGACLEQAAGHGIDLFKHNAKKRFSLVSDGTERRMIHTGLAISTRMLV